MWPPVLLCQTCFSIKSQLFISDTLIPLNVTLWDMAKTDATPAVWASAISPIQSFHSCVEPSSSARELCTPSVFWNQHVYRVIAHLLRVSPGNSKEKNFLKAVWYSNWGTNTSPSMQTILVFPAAASIQHQKTGSAISYLGVLLIKNKTDQGWPGCLGQITIQLHNNLVLN